jgi:hypothetical protein
VAPTSPLPSAHLSSSLRGPSWFPPCCQLTPSRIIALLRTHCVLVHHGVAILALANLYTSPYPVPEQSLRCLQVGDWVEAFSTSRLKLPSIPEGFLATSPLCGWHPPAAPALLALTPWPSLGGWFAAGFSSPGILSSSLLCLPAALASGQFQPPYH